jgi:hypothetical protein
MENNTNAVVPQGFYMDDDSKFIVDLTTRTTQYCSKDIDKLTDGDKAVLFNAINSPDHRISDMINTTIMVKDVFVEVVNCTNEETGEQTSCPRTVLVDADGNGYQAVSLGVFGSMKKIFGVFGEPATWKNPLPIKVKQLTKGKKNILNLSVDAVEMAKAAKK